MKHKKLTDLWSANMDSNKTDGTKTTKKTQRNIQRCMLGLIKKTERG